jgi:hypothetical protein
VAVRGHAEGDEEARRVDAVGVVEVGGVERMGGQGEVGGGGVSAVLVLGRLLGAGVLGKEGAVAVQVVKAHLRTRE